MNLTGSQKVPDFDSIFDLRHFYVAIALNCSNLSEIYKKIMILQRFTSRSCPSHIWSSSIHTSSRVEILASFVPEVAKKLTSEM